MLLTSAYGPSPEACREKWSLPRDYPMVAPAYREQRSAMARPISLAEGPCHLRSRNHCLSPRRHLGSEPDQRLELATRSGFHAGLQHGESDGGAVLAVGRALGGDRPVHADQSAREVHPVWAGQAA